LRKEQKSTQTRLMEPESNYTCPNCARGCSVAASLVGQNCICPNCQSEFYATPPIQKDPTVELTSQTSFWLPEKLPFLKSSRKKILMQRLDELMVSHDGIISEEAENELNRNGVALGLPATEGSELLKEIFMSEFEPIKQRMVSSFLMTDDDVLAIDQLKTKYNVKMAITGDAALFRAIYLMESTGKPPAPIKPNLMLEPDEYAYHSVQSVWQQTRVHSHGYSGTSVSLPTGIKGVRFRFGGYTPIKTEDITALSNGVLYITSHRLLFNGDLRNTTINLKKIVDAHIFTDCLKLEKATGKPDYFTMNAVQSRYVLALIYTVR